jgi:hypothetical protein
MLIKFFFTTFKSSQHINSQNLSLLEGDWCDCCFNPKIEVTNKYISYIHFIFFNVY